jgi:hypothetical protein
MFRWVSRHTPGLIAYYVLPSPAASASPSSRFWHLLVLDCESLRVVRVFEFMKSQMEQRKDDALCI